MVPNNFRFGGAYWTSLELSSTIIHRERVSPHPSPLRGRAGIRGSPYQPIVRGCFSRLQASPNSVGFSLMGFASLRAARGVRPCSPKTSLVAHATHGFPHQRVYQLKDNAASFRKEEHTDECCDQHGLVRKDSGAFCACRHTLADSGMPPAGSIPRPCSPTKDGELEAARFTVRAETGYPQVTANAVTLPILSLPKVVPAYPVVDVPPRSGNLGSGKFKSSG